MTKYEKLIKENMELKENKFKIQNNQYNEIKIKFDILTSD